MECLTGIIGINPSVGTATSGLYITDLPDISMSKLTKLTDSEDEDIASVFAEIERRTIMKFVTLFTIELNKCFKINQREKVECLICENKTLLSVSLWYLMGSETMNEQINSSRINRYTTIDKSKARELLSQFSEDFADELHTAILGLDFANSECFPSEEIVNNYIIHTAYSKP